MYYVYKYMYISMIKNFANSIVFQNAFEETGYDIRSKRSRWPEKTSQKKKKKNQAGISSSFKFFYT